jgi:hypothetical protein
MLRLVISVIVVFALAGCGGGTLKWYTNCGGCGYLPPAPDGGWAAGTCTTQQVGAACTKSGDTCSVSADPCVAVLICSTDDPTQNCKGPIP